MTRRSGRARGAKSSPVFRADPPHTGAWGASPSTTSGSWRRCWWTPRTGRCWSPRALQSWCWLAAPQCPRSRKRRSTACSRKELGSWQWRLRATSATAKLTAGDERDLTLVGFLTFVDRPKADAGEAISRLHGLGIEVKIITGDNGTVAATVCRQIGVDPGTVVTGAEIDAMDDESLMRGDHKDLGLRPSQPGSEVADHQGDTANRRRRRVPR